MTATARAAPAADRGPCSGGMLFRSWRKSNTLNPTTWHKLARDGSQGNRPPGKQILLLPVLLPVHQCWMAPAPC